MVIPLILAGLLAATATQAADAPRRMTPELLWQLGRLSGGEISPDGQWVVYSVKRYELAEDKGNSDLYLAPLAGGPSRAITSGDESESSVQWVQTDAGARLFFVSKRGEDEDATPQAWSMDPASGEMQQLTEVEGGIGNLKVSPTGTHLAFTVDVKLDPTVNELHSDLPKADARIIDDLLYRHWDSWHDYKYSHLHVARLGADGKAEPAIDLMKGRRIDCPVPPFGGSEQFAWSPDGQELAYTTKITNNPALSTDTDVYLVALDAPTRSRCITAGMDGYDMEPNYSPDGRWLVFQSMERPGFEADRNRIMVYDRKDESIRELSEGFDWQTHDLTWAPDSESLYYRAEWRGTEQLFRVALDEPAVSQLTDGVFNWSLRDVSADGKTLLVARRNMIRPWELGTLQAGASEFRPLTDVNGELYKDLELPTIEERWVRATDGERIHCWVILPPDFDADQQWPMLTYCQGGPQGQVGQWFSYRWNFHLMAAQGYVVLAVNRRGLPGFGQDWNDQISGDWGGQAMQDILAATDDMLTEPFVDARRCAAIGASFGGYTGYWLMGNHQDRFATIIAHAGLFNLESFWGSTEELFFPDWDVGGAYWESDDLQLEYDFHSPHRYVQNWKTPLLIIHGQKDFRVPVTQAMEAFTAAKLQGVPVRFLYYPGEGHWILKPQNGVLWHRTFFDWLSRYCQPGM